MGPHNSIISDPLIQILPDHVSHILSDTIWDILGLSETIWDYLQLSRTRVQVKAGESKILLFETFSFFFYYFLPERFLEELALLKSNWF